MFSLFSVLHFHVLLQSWSSSYCIKLFWHLLLYLSFLPIKFKADTNNFDQSLTSIKIVYRKHLKATHPKRIPPHMNQNGQSSIGFQKNLFKPPTHHLPPATFNTHYYQYTRPNRKSASSKHTLSGPQKTDSGLLMHYQPYS